MWPLQSERANSCRYTDMAPELKWKKRIKKKEKKTGRQLLGRRTGCLPCRWNLSEFITQSWGGAILFVALTACARVLPQVSFSAQCRTQPWPPPLLQSDFCWAVKETTKAPSGVREKSSAAVENKMNPWNDCREIWNGFFSSFSGLLQHQRGKEHKQKNKQNRRR